ncbi:MAG: proline dehydrogenase family protein [Flavobacteriales bacterium]|nr:proline dehydrogenase family protein [Flavobacteriales bacterium]
MVAFDNTAIAFADRSDAELSRAELLFRMVGSPTMVKMGQSVLKMALSLQLPVTGIIRSTVFNHFCGGESVADCEQTVQRLHAGGVHTLLDYSAEGTDSEADFDRAAAEVVKTIVRATTDRRIPFAVFKPTGIVNGVLLEKVSSGTKLRPGEQTAYDRGMARVRGIAVAAAEHRVPVLVDSEETWLHAAVDGFVTDLMEEFNHGEVMVYNTFQMYCSDRLDFLKESHGRAMQRGYLLGAKLVRGAYMEQERERAAKKGYPSPIHPTKEETDVAYDAALDYCVKHLDSICLMSGTHNEASSHHLIRLLQEQGIARDDRRVFSAQLYGMSDNISFNLGHAGYNVVKYVPYGPVRLVMPYLIRRAEENTSVAGQVGRELSLILKEKQRRRAHR